MIFGWMEMTLGKREEREMMKSGSEYFILSHVNETIELK
jgi:hypothetical protein